MNGRFWPKAAVQQLPNNQHIYSILMVFFVSCPNVQSCQLAASCSLMLLDTLH